METHKGFVKHSTEIAVVKELPWNASARTRKPMGLRVAESKLELEHPILQQFTRKLQYAPNIDSLENK